MNKIDFNNYAQNYQALIDESVGMSGESLEYFTNYKLNCLERWFVSKRADHSLRVLDFGSGIGLLSNKIAHKFNSFEVTGYDPSEESITRASELNKGVSNLTFTNSISDDYRADIVIAANVFHHISIEDRAKTLQMICRLIAPNGHFIVFEHNPWNPLTQKVVKTCPFDADAVLLSMKEWPKLARKNGLRPLKCRFIVFFPSFLRVFRSLEPYLTWLPVGAQYCYDFVVDQD